jgi:hypothetical protein
MRNSVSATPMSLLRCRLAGALFFIFIFFLPFHFHPITSGPELRQECSCVCGTRTQTGLGPAPLVLVLSADFSLVVCDTREATFKVDVEFESARAPPYSV